MSKQILLTQGKVAVVDDADYVRLSRYKWYAYKSRGTWYVARAVRKDGKRTTVQMHREILKPPTNKETDHKDGDGLNNQRSNLRVATCAQNQQNRTKQEGTMSRFKGVRWHRRTAQWQTQIRVEGKLLHIGLFLSEVEAAQAYDRAARMYFGEFANVNFGGFIRA